MTELYKNKLSQNNKILVSCRICLQEDALDEESVDFLADPQELRNKIFMCTQILLNNDNCLPNKICKMCINELEFANAFRLKCLFAEHTLTNYQRFIRNSYSNIDVKESKIDPVLSDQEPDCFQNESDTDVKESKIDHPEVLIKEETLTNKETFSDRSQLQCNYCGTMLNNQTSLQSHLKSMHHNRNYMGEVTGHGSERLHHCTLCSYTSKRKQALVYHIRTHTGEKPYHCECGKKFAQPGSLVSHQKSSHSELLSYTCTTCGKQFKLQTHLSRHQKVHMKGTLVCDICKKVLKSKSSLKFHIRRHYNVKDFGCEECGVMFVSAPELYNHKKKHDKVLRFQCNLCDYSTYLKKLLSLHLKRHSGERTYKCDICDKLFYTSHEVVCHKRKHTREKKYPCPVCEQKFSHSSGVNRHVRRVHKLDYLWSEDVDRTKVKLINSIEIINA